MKKNLRLSSFALSGAIMLFIAACNYVMVPEDEDATHKAKVKTAEVTGITPTTAICGGEIISDGGSDITACGVVWGLAENPAVNMNRTSKTVDTVGTFVSSVTALQPGKTYYIRAYAYNENGYAYGEQFTFTTDSVKMEMIDLGLNVKWAACNLGAISPEELGDFYAWGEMEPYYDDGHSQDMPCNQFRTMRTGAGKSSGIYSRYNYFERNSEGKFCEWSTAPYDVTGKLKNDFDAANAKLGSSWRIPTKQDWAELFSRCNATWISEKGMVGYKFTTKSGDASIFLPAASKWEYNSWMGDEAGEKGYYWSSSLVTSDTTKYTAFAASFDKTSKTILDTTGFRHLGFSIRPVCDK